jgi:hypothetical protein
MLKIIEDFFSDDEIQQIKSYWEKNKENTVVFYHDGEVIYDRKLPIPDGTPELNMIEDKIRKVFPNFVSNKSVIQEQVKPHNIHIDEYGTDGVSEPYTFVVALETVSEFKTMVWKTVVQTNQLLGKFAEAWGADKDTLEKKSNISKTEDLEHTYDTNQNDYMCDYLELDGIYQYRAGSACVFPANQLHCSSNWTKYPKFKTRQLLQIHLLVPKNVVQ